MKTLKLLTVRNVGSIIIIVLTSALFTPKAAAQTGQSDYMFASAVDAAVIEEGGLYSQPEIIPSASTYMPKSATVKLVGKVGYFYKAIYNNLIGYISFSIIDENRDAFLARNYPRAKLMGKMSYAATLLSEARFDGPVVLSVPQGAEISLERYNDSYWLAEHEGHLGYIGTSYVKVLSADASDDSYKFRYTPVRPSKPVYHPSSAPTRARRSVVQQQYYIRGPRGGCYYITGSGRKEYVDRSLCD